MSRALRSFLPVLFLALACTPREAPPAAGAGPGKDPLGALYIELEQKHTRSVDRFGYSLEYAMEPPNTIVITLTYRPLSDESAKGKDVAEGARAFVRQLAAEKYGIANLNIRSETRRLEP